MRIEELIGKMAVRTKAIITRDFLNPDRVVPNASYCTEPVMVVAVEDGVVYIKPNYSWRTEQFVEILSPIYQDDNWAPVNEERLRRVTAHDTGDKK